MKNFTILFIFSAFLWTSTTDAQSKKIPFVEHFSNTKCPICQSARPGIYNDLKKYDGEVNHLTIHRQYPYSTCPLYQYSKTEADNREAVYSGSTAPLSGTPTLCVNSSPGHYSSLTRRIDMALDEEEVPVGLDMVEKGTGSKEVTLVVTNRTNDPMDNLYVYAALVQKVVNINVDNTDWEIHDVFRKFLGQNAGKGDKLNTVNPGESSTIKLEGEVPHDLDPSDLYVIAWVEQRVPDGNKYNLIMHNSVSVTTATITNTELKIPPSELSIYPNPVRDVIHIRNTSDFNPHQYRILSVTGQEIKKMNAVSSVQISDLTPGQYYLIMENENSRVSRKFIKQ